MDSESKLEAIASVQEHRVEALINNYKDQVMQIAGRTGIYDYMEGFNNTGSLINIELLRIRAIDAKSSSAGDYKDVYILDKTGKIITSSNTVTNDGYLDINVTDLSKTDAKIIVTSKINESKHVLLVAPVLRNNEFVGYVAVLEGITELSEIVSDYSGLGDTGETVLAYRNSSGDIEYFIPPRFALNSPDILISKDRTNIAIVQAMMKNEAFLKNTIAYNGKDINAVTKYFDEVDWGLVVKVDKSELNKPLYDLIIQILIISLVSIIIYAILSYYLARLISKPIEELRLGVKEIQDGNYEYRSNLKSSDEIGQLATGFNKMISSVVGSNSDVDKRVESQTKEIIEKQKSMDDQRRAIMNVLEDVEQEKEKVSQEKDKIDAVLYSIGDGVFVIDKDYNIVILNPVAARISGFSQEQAIGKKYFDILKFSAEGTGKINDDFIKNVFKTGKVQEMSQKTVITRKNGQVISVADSAAPLKDRNGKIIGCVVVFRDVTRERDIDRAKTEFVSLASHQLRTPLSAVNWYAEMLIDGDAGKINKQQKLYLDEIYRGNQRMVDLVNSLLNVSRLDLGTFEIVPKPLKLCEIVDDIAEEMGHTITEKKQKFINSCSTNDPKINADPKLMRVIMQNLISNAIKYSPEGSNISVSMTYNPKNPASTYNIKVSDNGYGIPNNQKDKIFTKLFRADNIRAMDTEGTGLGLYIVKSILDEAGGKISFDSIENKGTTFTVSLPEVGMKQKSGTKSIN